MTGLGQALKFRHSLPWLEGFALVEVHFHAVRADLDGVKFVATEGFQQPHDARQLPRDRVFSVFPKLIGLQVVYDKLVRLNKVAIRIQNLCRQKLVRE